MTADYVPQVGEHVTVTPTARGANAASGVVVSVDKWGVYIVPDDRSCDRIGLGRSSHAFAPDGAS